MPLADVTVTVRLTNAKAVRALACAARFVAEMADRYPFDPDAQKAKRAAEYAAKHLGLANSEDH